MMFGLSMSPLTTSGLEKKRQDLMSLIILSVAVAVNARIWCGLSLMTASVSDRYAGRKLFPHCDITWASSTTMRLIFLLDSLFRTYLFWRLSGVLTMIFVPSSSFLNTSSRCAFVCPPRMHTHSIPAWRSFDIWSFIRARRG